MSSPGALVSCFAASVFDRAMQREDVIDQRAGVGSNRNVRDALTASITSPAQPGQQVIEHTTAPGPADTAGSAEWTYHR